MWLSGWRTSRSQSPTRALPTRALLTIRGFVVGLLDAGYTREALYEDIERARSVLKRRGAPEETEETILDVMDFLVGFSSSFMKF